jgi:hypothetical protein
MALPVAGRQHVETQTVDAGPSVQTEASFESVERSMRDSVYALRESDVRFLTRLESSVRSHLARFCHRRTLLEEKALRLRDLMWLNEEDDMHLILELAILERSVSQ